MSKQRALELCDEATKFNGGHEEYSGIICLAGAIRELAKCELKPEPKVTLRDEIWNLVVYAYRHELEADDLTNRIMGRINSRLSPKSDPPGPT